MGKLAGIATVTVVAVLLVSCWTVTEASLYGPFGPFAGQFGPAAGAFPGGAFPGVAAFPGFQFPVQQLPTFLPPGLGFGRALPVTAPAPVPLPVTAPTATNLRTVVSGSDVLSRLAVAELPEDLQKRAQDLQAASEQGFDACDELLATPGAYWQYKRCQAFQLRNALTAAKALEQEATARAEAAAAAAAAAANAEVPAA